MNNTELAQLALMNEIPGAGPHVPRAKLIHALKTLKELGTQGAMDRCRNRLIAFLIAKWDIVEMQVPKELCGKHPRCYGCPDIQVAMCYRENQRWMT